LNKPLVDSKKSIVKIKIVVHEAEEGGFWAEVPAILGCATQGDSMEDLIQNLHEAIEGCLEAPARTERR
jgi:predicted RNase H-like HicB family nuclease